MFFLFSIDDPATTEIYTLSLHDALPISRPSRPKYRIRSGPLNERSGSVSGIGTPKGKYFTGTPLNSGNAARDRKSTRLNSSHTVNSYAVFCLKKKKNYSCYKYRVNCR